MKNKVLGKEVNELYEWMRLNWPSAQAPSKRQKNELKSILKAAVNRRTKDLQKRLIDCQNELHD